MPDQKEPITLEQIFAKLTNHDVQFASLARQIFAFEDSFHKEIRRLDARIGAIERNLEKFTGDFETLTQEYHMITVALKRIEIGMDNLDEAADSHRLDLDSLKQRLAAIEDRLLALESK